MIAALLALAIFVVMPACGPFAEYGLVPSDDQARFLDHFLSLRDGSRRVISYRGTEGLITFPSFHVAWAMVIVWAVRKNRPALAGFATINTLLILSTMTTGWHYFADVLGGAAVATLGVLGATYMQRETGFVGRPS
jgi:membrane-associated phospholipid phosphatase